MSGVQVRPLPKVQQVGLLEAGTVLIQYKGLRAGDVQRLEGLAGPDAVVAPAVELPNGDKVVATAWMHKLACDSVDVDAVKGFVAAHKGKGPGST